jgi:undecaprenyl-diphosphatase
LNAIEAIVLGIVQGLTEFLPVSSSGHLVLFQHLFGMPEPELLFDICLHVGTLVAVLVVFLREIITIIVTLVRIPILMGPAGGLVALVRGNESVRISFLIVMGSLPTAILGMLFKEIADQLFGNIWIVGLTLILTGTILWLTRRLTLKGKPIVRMTIKDALIIGLVQGLAIIPGISRSGATISTALFLGVDRDVAGRFSFLLSIPAILGALMLGLDAEELQTTIPAGLILTGTIASAIVGYLALIILLRLVRKGQFYRFAPYCWVVGVVALVLGLI